MTDVYQSGEPGTTVTDDELGTSADARTVFQSGEPGTTVTDYGSALTLLVTMDDGSVGVSGAPASDEGAPEPPPSLVDFFTLDDDPLAGGIDWLYGLQEREGARTAGDVSGAPGRPKLGLTRANSLGEATPGAAGILPEGTAWEFRPETVDGATGGYTLGSAQVAAYLGGEWTAFAVFAWSGGADTVRLLRIGSTDVGLTVTVAADRIQATLAAGLVSRTVTHMIDTDGNTPIMVVVTVSGDTLAVSTAGDTTSATITARPGTVTGLTIGDNTVAARHQVAWVGFSTAAMTVAEAQDFANLGSGGSERSDLRVARICRWVGVGADLVADTGLSDIAGQAAGGAAALDLIAAVNDVEDGTFFAAADGRLVFHSRARRYDAPVAVTLDAGEVDPSLAVEVDLTRVVNDLSVSRPAGATARARDQASISTYGERANAITLWAATDDAAEQAAAWRVLRYATVTPRIPALTVNLLPLSADRAAEVLGLDIGDRIQITGMPATTPGGTTVDLFVEGIEDTISPTEWSVTLSTSPAWAVDVGILDDAASTLDTDFLLAY